MNQAASLLLVCAATAALAPHSKAQDLTISDGNMVYRTAALSVTSDNPRTCDLRTDGTNTDSGFEHWWYYRISGDTREHSFKNVGGVARGVTTGGTHADSDFDDVDSRGQLRARMDWDIYSSGPSSGVVVCRLNLVNMTAGPLTVSVFNYLDVDLAAMSTNQVTGDNSHHYVTDASGIRLEYRAYGNDRSDVGAAPSIRNLLTDNSVSDLSNTLPPFSGDYSGAFEWQNRVFAPGEWRTFTVAIAVDTVALVIPINENYGIGSGVTPEIFTDGIALQNNSLQRTIDVRLRGARPNAPVGLLSNGFSQPGIQFLGVFLWVDPNAPAQLPIGLTTNTGEVSVTFTIPNSPYLCGLSVYHQYFVADNTAPNGQATFTGGLVTTVGKL